MNVESQNIGNDTAIGGAAVVFIKRAHLVMDGDLAEFVGSVNV